MALKPKHTFNSAPIKAQRIFTDRELPRETFRKAIHNFDSTEHSVINFYGFGGIGKSRLLKELSKSESLTSDWCHVRIDMEDPAYQNCAFCLRSLRQTLAQQIKPKPSFRSFDFAYLIYLQKVNPDITINDPSLEYLQTSDLMTDIAQAMVETLEALPVASVVTKLAVLGKKGVNVLDRWWSSAGSRIFKELPSLTPQQIEERLPMMLAEDLNAALDKVDAQKLCVFIDSYEAMWDNAYREGHFFSVDEWVREWITHHPNVLFVIAGRDKLRWPEYQSDWAEVLDAHILESLSDTDARYFLESCDIQDPEIVDVIVENSKGVPFYLDVSVDTYQKIKFTLLRPPTPDDFQGKTQREILDRFIRYLDRAESATLKVLANCRYFDSQLFQYMIRQYNTGYPATDLDRLTQHSFIQTLPGQAYSINPLMKRALIDHQSDESKNTALTCLFYYYADQINGINGEAQLGYKHFIEAQHYFESAQISEKDREDFLHLSGKLYQQQCRMDEALSVFEDLAAIGSSPETIGEARVQIAMTLRQHGQTSKALTIIEPLIEVAHRSHLEMIRCRAMTQRGLCYLSLGLESKDSEYFQRSYQDYQEALGIAKALDNTAETLYINLSMSTAMEHLGQIDESIELLRQTKAIAAQNDLHHSYTDCLNGLARKHLLKGEYQQAIERAEEGLALWQRSGFYRGQLVMYCHILNAHAQQRSDMKHIEKILVNAEQVSLLVTEQVICDMYEQARSHWVDSLVASELTPSSG
jgi:tetratricopeptide (TPR) repeat protein